MIPVQDYNQWFFFYCVNKQKHAEAVRFKVEKVEAISMGNDMLSVVSFKCPDLGNEILYKITGTDTKQILRNASTAMRSLG